MIFSPSSCLRYINRDIVKDIESCCELWAQWTCFSNFLFISSDVFLHIIDDCCDKTVYFELFLNSRKLSASNSSTSILQLTASPGDNRLSSQPTKWISPQNAHVCPNTSVNQSLHLTLNVTIIKSERLEKSSAKNSAEFI